MNYIHYKSGYKYQLCESYSVSVSIKPSGDIVTDYVRLTKDGILSMVKGYAWDGPSGPAVDTKEFMRASLVHDALYQLIRLGLLSLCCREFADLELLRICREDGMSKWYSYIAYLVVRALGGSCCDSARENPIIQAP